MWGCGTTSASSKYNVWYLQTLLIACCWLEASPITYTVNSYFICYITYCILMIKYAREMKMLSQSRENTLTVCFGKESAYKWPHAVQTLFEDQPPCKCSHFHSIGRALNICSVQTKEKEPGFKHWTVYWGENWSAAKWGLPIPSGGEGEAHGSERGDNSLFTQSKGWEDPSTHPGRSIKI